MFLFKRTYDAIREQNALYAKCINWQEKIENAHESLFVLVELHKQMWKDGLRCPNIGPCEYGMFRTNDIETMTTSEVYLGDIYGLWTFSAERWEEEKGTDNYHIVCEQYRNHLVSNIRMMRNHIFDGGIDRKILSQNILNSLFVIGKNGTPGNIAFSKVEFISASLSGNQILRCQLHHNGREIETSCLLVNGIFYLPERFENGVRLEKFRRRDLASLHYMEPLEALRNNRQEYKPLHPKDAAAAMHSYISDAQLTRTAVKACLAHLDEMKKRGFLYALDK